MRKKIINIKVNERLTAIEVARRFVTSKNTKYKWEKE